MVRKPTDSDAIPLLPSDLPAMVRVPRVAELLDLSTSAVWRMVWSGELPSVRIGERNVRIPREGLENYLNRRLSA